MNPPLRLEREGHVALLFLDDAARLNPLSEAMQIALREKLRDLAADRDVRALVITGVGRAFCVGADLSAMGPASDGPGLGHRTADRMHALSNRVIADLRQLPFPVISAVNGPCAGAGVGLALAADIVVASRSAYFYLPFMAKLGIVPDLGCTWFLERLLGPARATGLTLLGDRLSAQKAADWGVIWSCVEDEALSAEAMSIARRLTLLPPQAALETRRAFEAAGRQSLEAQLDYEAERQRHLIDAPSFREGVRAFLEKREPQFAGRE
jgi:2-(1,2-epoxy-1,2-dihydrophenyl)acetyl-CoA isomerase